MRGNFPEHSVRVGAFGVVDETQVGDRQIFLDLCELFEDYPKAVRFLGFVIFHRVGIQHEKGAFLIRQDLAVSNEQVATVDVKFTQHIDCSTVEFEFVHRGDRRLPDLHQRSPGRIIGEVRPDQDRLSFRKIRRHCSILGKSDDPSRAITSGGGD